jgi:hypothetical protein
MAAAGPAPAGAAPRFGHPEVFATIFALSFAVARFLPVLAIPYACPFRAATGVPCATCGMTRAFVALAHGEVGAALAVSPLGALGAAACWGFALLALARALLGRPWPVPGPRAARAGAIALLAGLLANWAYVVIAHVA